MPRLVSTYIPSGSDGSSDIVSSGRVSPPRVSSRSCYEDELAKNCPRGGSAGRVRKVPPGEPARSTALLRCRARVSPCPMAPRGVKVVVGDEDILEDRHGRHPPPRSDPRIPGATWRGMDSSTSARSRPVRVSYPRSDGHPVPTPRARHRAQLPPLERVEIRPDLPSIPQHSRRDPRRPSVAEADIIR
jgi:hypothetical protein